MLPRFSPLNPSRLLTVAAPIAAPIRAATVRERGVLPRFQFFAFFDFSQLLRERWVLPLLRLSESAVRSPPPAPQGTNMRYNTYDKTVPAPSRIRPDLRHFARKKISDRPVTETSVMNTAAASINRPHTRPAS